MNSRQRKDGTSKALSRSKKSDANTYKNHHSQASGSASARVSHSSSLERIKAQQEEEEESSQSSDDVDRNVSVDEDEDSNADDISGDSSNDDPEDVNGLPSGSGLVIRIPSKRTADKPRIDKGKKHLHICILYLCYWSDVV